jgi:hypothetical protein
MSGPNGNAPTTARVMDAPHLVDESAPALAAAVLRNRFDAL